MDIANYALKQKLELLSFCHVFMQLLVKIAVLELLEEMITNAQFVEKKLINSERYLCKH